MRARFEWSTAVVVVDECGVDTDGMADPEGFEIGFEGVTDENGCGAALGCEDGKQLGLGLGEGRCGHGERCQCDAWPSR